MVRLFFLELPLSLSIALIVAYTSYIVAIGLASNLGISLSFLMWFLLALALVCILFLCKNAIFLKNKIVFKNAVFVFLPSITSIAGIVLLIMGRIN